MTRIIEMPIQRVNFTSRKQKSSYLLALTLNLIFLGMLALGTPAQAQTATSTPETATMTENIIPNNNYTPWRADIQIAALADGVEINAPQGVTVNIPITTSTPVNIEIKQLPPEELPPAAWTATTTTTTIWYIDITSPTIKPWLPASPLRISLPASGPFYGKKIISFGDDNLDRWRDLISTTDFKENKVSALYPLPFGRFIVRESETVFEGIASWYKWKGCNCAAYRFLPKQTRLKVTNISGSSRHGKSVTVRINDYGPEEWTGRLIDLDYVAYKKIGLPRGGLMPVRVEMVK